MHFSSTIAATVLLFASAVYAAPIQRRQIAGEGSACNSILSDFDNGVGYGVEDAEDGVAKDISRRQIAGEGAACDSILSDFDNGVGYGVENAEDNLADNISGKQTGGNAGSGGGSGSGGAPPPPPPPPPHRRQLDKISNGFKTLGNAAGLGTIADPVGNEGDSLDGQLTSAAANAGAEVGMTEETVLEGAGSAVPKSRRQLDKISNGFKTLGNSAGLGAVADPIGNEGDSLDGQLTSAAANAGAEVGQTEETILEGAGSAVPK